MALSKRRLISTDEGICQHQRHCTKHHGSKLYVYVVYEANTVSGVHALVAIVYQAVHISVTRTDTWQCHLTINLLRARHQPQCSQESMLALCYQSTDYSKAKTEQAFVKID